MDDPFWKDVPPNTSLLERLVGPDHVSDPRIDGVFEGGGAKAIAQVGAIRAVEEVGLRWNRVGGTSGGAIIAALLAKGLKAYDIWKILTDTDLARIMDVFYLPNIPPLRQFKYFYLPLLPNVFFFKGAFEGDEFEKLMHQHLGDMTFGNLPPCKEGKEESKDGLKIVATDITRRRPVVFPDHLNEYKTYAKENMPVYKAVRMSMSLPLVFKPVILQDSTGKKCHIVDGGISSNFPIWLFDQPASAGKPERPTFGFLLEERPETYRILTGLGILWNTIQTGIGAMDRRLSPWNDDRTVRIPVGDVATTDFNLSPERQLLLRDRGHKATMTFLQDFDWERHVREFRTEPTLAE